MNGHALHQTSAAVIGNGFEAHGKDKLALHREQEVCDPENVMLEDFAPVARKVKRASTVSNGSWQLPVRSPSFKDVKEAVALFDREESGRSNLFMFAIVGVVSALIGLVCIAMHELVKYAGCPLGINGCDKKKIPFSDFLGSVWVESTGTARSVLYLLLMPFCGLIVSLIQFMLPAELQAGLSGGGVVPTIQAVEDGAPLRGETVIFRLLYASIFVGAGHPMGIEGPSIYCGAAVALQFCWWCGLRSKAYCRLFGTAGAVAAISAAFNMPIAGITYVVEEYIEIVSRRSLSLFTIASVISTYVFRLFLGDHKVLVFPDAQTDFTSLGLFFLATLLGLICGVVGCCFTKGFLACRCIVQSDRVQKICPRILQLPVTGLAAAGLGAIVYALTDIKVSWGVGVPFVQEMVSKYDGTASWVPLLVAYVCRQIAVLLLASVGAPAGLLSPSLTLGGMLGGSLAALANSIFGRSDSLQPAIIFGMCGMFSAWFRMPATAVIVLFEVTGIYSFVLPAMLCSCVASLTSSGLTREHVYHSCVRHSQENSEDLDMLNHNGNGHGHNSQDFLPEVSEDSSQPAPEDSAQRNGVELQDHWHDDFSAKAKLQLDSKLEAKSSGKGCSCHKWLLMSWS